MKKLLNISVIAALAILPLAANAADIDKDPGVTNASGPTAQYAPKYSLATAATTDETNVATASYVKGAYNAAIKAINKVSETASFAGTDEELTNTNFQPTDKTSAAKAANAAMAAAQTGITNAATAQTAAEAAQTAAAAAQADADALEGIVGNTALQTSSQTVTAAINELKTTASFAGTDAELTNTNFQPTDKTSAAKAANAAMAAAQTGITNAATAQTAAEAAQTAAAAAQADADALEGIVGNTALTTTAQTLTGAIEEVKSNALTSSSLTDYAKKTGVTATISASTVSGTVPTVTTWGTETTGTAAVTGTISGASYRE